MLIAHLDESYDRDYYCLGAAVGTDEQWRDVGERFAVIRARATSRFGTAPDIEFHAHEIMGGNGAWSMMRGRHREAAALSVAVLAAARAAGIRYWFAELDVIRFRAVHGADESVHGAVLVRLLERLDAYATARDEHAPVRLIADEIATHEQHQVAFAKYQRAGTPGARPSYLRRLESPITFASSTTADGLQAIDLAVYVHRRRRRVSNPHPAARRTIERQWLEIEPNIESIDPG